MISLIWGLGLLLMLPPPQSFKGSDLFLTLLWLSSLFYTLTLGFFRNFVFLASVLAIIFSFIYALKSHFWVPTFLILLISVWNKIRSQRIKVSSILILLFPFISQAQYLGTLSNPLDNSLRHEERRLDSLASCAYLEKIPWEFRGDGYRVRKLFKEKLALPQDNKIYDWELFQMMNSKGEVTFVFRRWQDAHTYLSIAARDFKFLSALSRKKGSKTIDRQNLKDLLNRPALIFTRADGAQVSFLPGSMGKSTIMIQFPHVDTRSLPPVFIRGNFCDRPAIYVEGDVPNKNFVEGKGVIQKRPPGEPAGK